MMGLHMEGKVTLEVDWKCNQKVYKLHMVLNPGVHPWAGHPEVTGIPQVDSSTSQRQLISTHAEVTYLIKPPITTKPVVCTN